MMSPVDKCLWEPGLMGTPIAIRNTIYIIHVSWSCVLLSIKKSLQVLQKCCDDTYKVLQKLECQGVVISVTLGAKLIVTDQ